MVTFKPGPVQDTLETAPKRKAASASPRAPSNRSLKSEISGMLMTINLVILMIPPLRADQMDMVEIEALADALDEQCKKSIKFRRAMEAALGAGSGASLIGVVAIIGARRAARHNFIPNEADQQLGNLLAQGMQASKKARADAGLA
jgi:hypothetical protein